MKKTLRQADPLEETLENPDLPPLVPAGHSWRPTAAFARIGLRVSLALGTVALVIAFGVRLVG